MPLRSVSRINGVTMFPPHTTLLSVIPTDVANCHDCFLQLWILFLTLCSRAITFTQITIVPSDITLLSQPTLFAVILPLDENCSVSIVAQLSRSTVASTCFTELLLH